MKKIILALAVTLLAGCLATENRKVEITHRRADGSVASIDTETCWWRIPYYADRKDHPMDRFIPSSELPDSQHGLDSIEQDLLYFSENSMRWPEQLRAPYRPGPLWTAPALRKTEDSALRRRLQQPVLRGEVY